VRSRPHAWEDLTCNYDFKIVVDDNAHLRNAFTFRTLDFAMSRDEFSAFYLVKWKENSRNLFCLPFNFLSRQFGYHKLNLKPNRTHIWDLLNHHAQDVLNIFLGIEKLEGKKTADNLSNHTAALIRGGVITDGLTKGDVIKIWLWMW